MESRYFGERSANAVKNVLVFSAPLGCGLFVTRPQPASSTAPASNDAAHLLYTDLMLPPRVIAPRSPTLVRPEADKRRAL